MRTIPLKKVIKNFLGKNKSEKYLKGLEVVFTNKINANPMDVYQYALCQFAEGQTEKALNAIIFTLDIERDHKLTLHLCKTMLFGLTQYMMENQSTFNDLKKKYEGDLEGSISKLRKKIKEIEKILSEQDQELEKLEKEIFNNRSNFIFNLFKKGGIKKEIQELKNRIATDGSECENYKHEMNKIEDFLQKEEYLKVVGLIIEVCVFPLRFEQELAKTQYS